MRACRLVPRALRRCAATPVVPSPAGTTPAPPPAPRNRRLPPRARRAPRRREIGRPVCVPHKIRHGERERVRKTHCKRRDRINERMKALQKMVPNSSKTDKASMLDEVIEYLKQLQAQVQVISRMSSMPPMMMPMPMPLSMAQYQMSMLANMAQMSQLGMGRMDLSPLGQPTHPAMPSILHPTAFLPHLNGSSWDAANDRIQPFTVPVPVPVPTAAASSPILPDPFSATLVAGPTQTQQPMGMDMFNRNFINKLHQPSPRPRFSHEFSV